MSEDLTLWRQDTANRREIFDNKYLPPLRRFDQIGRLLGWYCTIGDKILNKTSEIATSCYPAIGQCG